MAKEAARMITMAAIWLSLLAVRIFLVLRYVSSHRTATANPAAATIIQPILSGDPALEACLRANALGNPGSHFLWMVDHHDAEGIRIANLIANEIDPVRIVTVAGPDPVDGENPKTAKLIRALPLVQTATVVVLDDDTVIDAAGISRLTGADLVTGLPVYMSHSTIWERLLGGFVNGNAILTYLPSAAAGAQRTVNGMIYATGAALLTSLGGFEAIQGELTDDYAVAQLYQRSGLSLLQTPVCVCVHVSVRDAAHFASLLRRWMIFANRYFRENSDWKTILLAGLPGLLPLPGLCVAAASGWRECGIWLALLTAGSCANRLLLRHLARIRSGPVDIAFEVLAALMLPGFWLTALFRPHALTWRTRRMDLRGGRIHYK